MELALLWVVGAHLVFLPWALGTMHVWSQAISLALSAIGFTLSMLPRDYTDEHTGMSAFRLLPWPKLLRFPIFWLGLALLVLVLLQALNPAWIYTTDGKSWWMQGVAHVAWLPSGVSVPFAAASGLPQGGPWRNITIYSSALMTLCSIWVGFTRRRTLQWLLVALAVNAVVLSAFGLSQRLLGASRIFWSVDSPNPSFFASFIYKNHAGAYLNLTLAVACGLAAWYYVRGVRRLEKSNPSGLFAFFITTIAVSILVSYARGATFVMMAYLCVVVGGFLYYQTKLPKESRSPIIAIAMLLVFGFFLKTGLEALNSDLAWDRLKYAMSGEDVSVRSREIATKASLDALRHHWGLGIGSGSFQFLFPTYQQHYPEILNADGRRLFWQHAHNDIVEIPLELGVPGLLILLASFGYWAITLVRNYSWQNPLTASVVLGLVFLVGMAWGEFVFQCPAVLITWCALWPISALWAQFEEQRARS